jgi:NAD(P)-dependent dehydrogenase (short-subunit alcohol dehydrogenase family)
MTADPAPALSGRVVAIVGGASRLGRHLAARLLGVGAGVALVDARAEGLSQVVAELGESSGRVAEFVVDVTSELEVQAGFTRILQRFDRLDGLVWSVNVPIAGGLEAMSAEEWRRSLDVHVTGNFLCVRAALPALERSRGAIVNVASIYAMVSPDPRIYAGHEHRGTPLVYAAAKGGLIAMTRYLAVYLAPRGIRVNAVSPGGIAAQQEPGFLARYVDRVPQRRMAAPVEVADTIVFLLGDGAGHITGQNLAVDGGLTAW